MRATKQKPKVDTQKKGNNISVLLQKIIKSQRKTAIEERNRNYR